MNLFHRLFALNDRRRARDFLQHACDDWLEARRKFDEATRRADRALRDAQDVEPARYCKEFFGKRDPVRTGFAKGSAKLFGIKEPTRIKINVLPLAAIGPTKYWAGHYRPELTKKVA